MDVNFRASAKAKLGVATPLLSLSDALQGLEMRSASPSIDTSTVLSAIGLYRAFQQQR